MKKFKFVWKVGAVLAICASGLSASYAETLDESQTKEDISKWSGYVSVTYGNNWADDYRSVPQVDLDLKVAYKYSDDISMGVRTGAYYLDTRYCSTHTKDYWCASPTYVYGRLNNLYKFGDDIATLNLNGSLLLPTSHYSRDTNLYVGAIIAPSFSIGVEKYLDGLSLTLQPSLTKYFNKYETAGGTNLTEYRLRLGLATSYQITEKLVFSLSAANSHYVTYKGDTLYPSVSHSEELGYDLTDDFYLGVGYSNNTQFYNPDRGPNPLSGLFDDKDPHYYLTSSYSF